MNEKIIKDGFCIKIDFEKPSKEPTRIFRAMTNLIETFQPLDTDLVKTIDVKIRIELILEDIEAGSIKSWLKKVIEAIEDDAFKNLEWKKIISTFLCKAKYSALNYLKEKNEISERQELEDLSNFLLKKAEETDIKHLLTYAPIPIYQLAKNLQRVNFSLSYLQENDSAIYVTQYGNVPFNKKLRIDEDRIEELLTKERLSTKSEMILLVKKPDYLGLSMWDCKYGDRPFPVKILDTDWLKKFQSRKIDVRPGDAIRGIVQIELSYGYDNRLIAEHYSILQVLEVIQNQSNNQENLFLNE